MISNRILCSGLFLIAAPVCAASPHIDTLSASEDADSALFRCASDDLCVELSAADESCDGQACDDRMDGDSGLSLKLSDGHHARTYPSYRIKKESTFSGDESALTLWPSLIRFDGGVLAGVESQATAAYSGGGGSSTTLHLIAFLDGQSPFEVLSVPLSANITIRACFSDEDITKRAGACHDEYNYTGLIVPTGKMATGMPVLHYQSKATSFPGRVSRSKDSLAGRPLRKKDIVVVTNHQCTYERLFSLGPKSRIYVPDMQLPDCSDYIDP